MKKKDFLTNIIEQGRLGLVEPSEEIKSSYLEKSESNLISAKLLLDNKRLEESVSLIYYSMYHLVIALLFKIGIKSENHSASIILLKDIFDIDNNELFNAKKERIDKQYYTDFKIAKEEVLEFLKIAEGFNNLLHDFINRLNSNDILNYKNKFKELIKNLQTK